MRKIGLFVGAVVVLGASSVPAHAKVGNCSLDYVTCVYSCGPINQQCLSACATAYSNCASGLPSATLAAPMSSLDMSSAEACEDIAALLAGR